MSMCIRI